MKVITRDLLKDKIPHAWHQVSFKQYIRLCKASDDYLSIISIFLDIPIETLRIAKVENFDTFIRSLAFMKKAPEWVDTPYELGGIKLPKDVTWETTGQFEDMRKIIKTIDPSNSIGEIEKYGMIAAIYYQPMKDGSEYDSKKAEALVSEIENMSCVEVVSVGRFFFSKLIASLNNMPDNFLIQGTRPKRRRRASRPWLRRLTSTVLSIFYRGATSPKKNRF